MTKKQLAAIRLMVMLDGLQGGRTDVDNAFDLDWKFRDGVVTVSLPDGNVLAKAVRNTTEPWGTRPVDWKL